jgi:hypothetical protein
MTMSPYCSLAMQNNPRSTIHSLYRSIRDFAKEKNIKLVLPSPPARIVIHNPYAGIGRDWYKLGVMESQCMIIGLTMKGIVEAWKLFNKNDPTVPKDENGIIGKINSGDCGLVAIVANHILQQKYNIRTEIWMNDNHCWIVHGGRDYDTFCPEGYPDPFGASGFWSDGDSANVLKKTKLTLEEACQEWMPCDAFGGYLIKGICDNHAIRFPQALQHCIDNAEKYDSPEMVAIYKQRAAEIAVR